MAINFNKAEFVLSAVKPSTFIRDGRPQVTFAGRSNVGKSSVINRLLNRKNFARVGATPGKSTECPMVVVANKLDKLKKSEIEPNLALIRQTLTLDDSVQLIPFSAEKGIGKTELLAAIGQWCGK